MIRRLLVANRGEIARRVFRTCRDLGIAAVAVHSDPDADALHVREADAAVRLPGSAAADTYLRADPIIEAARTSGADAIHPGYGFLSENADFARAVIAAGLTWVGPPVEAIEAMGSKIEAKALMAAAGVPVLERLDPEAVTEADLPVLVKASAGGGGRGMRVVEDLASLAAEIELASVEAASAFGDPTVFCERYIPAGHHVEVQVLADGHGTIWAVGERECSIQRRHQKIVEEAPSPLVERIDGMRAAVFDAARAAVSAVGYVGAGTVELLADDEGRFYFLEMNTRLQVEHPVTEATTGLDLVALQILVAEGGRLPATPPPTSGHAIEVRLYAEDPAQDWLPQTGTVERFEVPGVDAEFAGPVAPHRDGCAAAALRLDTGVTGGTVVGVHYDPMLAKLIAWAPNRHSAARRLTTALRGTRIHGLRTNRDLLVRIAEDPAFLAGDTDTAFLGVHDLAALAAPLADDRTRRLSAVAATVALAADNRARAVVAGGLPSGWRNVPSQPQHKSFDVPSGSGDTERIDVRYRFTPDGLKVAGDDRIELVTAAVDRVVLRCDGVEHGFDVARYDGLVCVDSPLGAVDLVPVDRFPDPATQVTAGSLLAPMPGAIIRMAVAVGDRVERGQPILWLEAMKMQHQINAPADGVVAELHVEVGRQVELGTVLAVVKEQEEP